MSWVLKNKSYILNVLIIENGELISFKVKFLYNLFNFPDLAFEFLVRLFERDMFMFLFSNQGLKRRVISVVDFWGRLSVEGIMVKRIVFLLSLVELSSM